MTTTRTGAAPAHAGDTAPGRLKRLADRLAGFARRLLARPGPTAADLDAHLLNDIGLMRADLAGAYAPHLGPLAASRPGRARGRRGDGAFDDRRL